MCAISMIPHKHKHNRERPDPVAVANISPAASRYMRLVFSTLSDPASLEVPGRGPSIFRESFLRELIAEQGERPAGE
jgi:hypothetical protein